MPTADPPRPRSLSLYPLNAPGLMLPGPDFIRAAHARGDDTLIQKVTVPGTTRTGKPSKKQTTVLASPGDVLVELHRRALTEPGFTLPVAVRDGQAPRPVAFVPGHLWGEGAAAYLESTSAGGGSGPRPARVMVVGKMPWHEETMVGRNLVGESGSVLIEIVREYRITGSPDWYVTNLLKFTPPDGGTELRADWLKDCLPLLHQELRIVRPDYILCLGADASKHLMTSVLGSPEKGRKYNVEYMDGRVVEVTFPVDRDAPADGRPPETHTALMMCVVHPAAVARDPALKRRLTRGLIRFGQLQQGIRFDLEERDVDHRTVRTLDELRDLLAEVEYEIARGVKTDNWVGVDAEWHGEHPQNAGSYVRTIQFAWRARHAACLVWSDTTGACAFFDAAGEPAHAQAVELLNEFFADKRVCGHFLVADLEWLVPLGLTNLLTNFEVPLYDLELAADDPLFEAYRSIGYAAGDTVPAFMRTHFEGGWDTGLAAHAIEETAQLGLEVLTTRYTTVPRYEGGLDQWITAYCKLQGIKRKDLEGYGPVPDEVLIPYANYDPDGTLRLMYEQTPLIDSDYEGNCCRESFWESMLTPPVILEMHQTGVPVARDRIDENTLAFMKARAAHEKKIKAWAKWPDFNIRSVQHVREFLFGEELNDKRTKDGRTVRIRPDGAISLGLAPVLDTSKPPRRWAEIVDKGLQKIHRPSTAKTILGVLVQDNPAQSEQVQMIRDYRFLDQVLKSVLRPPKLDEYGQVVHQQAPDPGRPDELYDALNDLGVDHATGQEASPYAGQDNLGGMVYEAGLASVICGDGRVRTHFYPTTETKRWRSSRPPLQQLSKRRDPDYVRLLGGTKNAKGKWVGGEYKHKLRSMIHAIPGHVLVEADYIGAELYLMAVMSGDAKMIEHATRNQLPEDHADYYDIHSHVAVTSFGLKCPPTKKGLEAAGAIALRVAAKNVIFGVAYGRGAKAIALQCKEEGNPITVDQAQQIIDMIFRLYPGLVPFFAEARARAKNPGWVCSAFGAYRRFPATKDKTMLGEFERQSMNFGIQSGIASCMDRALAYLRDYRDNFLGDPAFFRLALQIHDAVVLHVPYANVDAVCRKPGGVLAVNMSDRVDIWPTRLNGRPTGAGPYHLGIDVEVFQYWGESLSKDFCRANGIPETYGK